MICFRCTPLWRIEKTEEWLYQKLLNGYMLKKVIGPLYFFSPIRQVNANMQFWLDFFEKGIESHYFFLWNTRYRPIKINCVSSFYTVYRFVTSSSKNMELDNWRGLRLVDVRKAMLHRILCSLLFLVFAPVALFTKMNHSILLTIVFISFIYLLFSCIGYVIVRIKLAQKR